MGHFKHPAACSLGYAFRLISSGGHLSMKTAKLHSWRGAANFQWTSNEREDFEHPVSVGGHKNYTIIFYTFLRSFESFIEAASIPALESEYCCLKENVESLLDISVTKFWKSIKCAGNSAQNLMFRLLSELATSLLFFWCMPPRNVFSAKCLWQKVT